MSIDHVLSDVSYEPNGCWRYTARLDHHGYGRLHWQGRTRKAHQVTYEHFVGPVPEGLELDHECRNRACCNPEHLRPMTHRDNVLCGEGVAARRARQTHCIHGHEFTPENTAIKRGCRNCKTCDREQARARRRRKTAASTT